MRVNLINLGLTTMSQDCFQNVGALSESVQRHTIGTAYFNSSLNVTPRDINSTEDFTREESELAFLHYVWCKYLRGNTKLVF